MPRQDIKMVPEKDWQWCQCPVPPWERGFTGPVNSAGKSASLLATVPSMGALLFHFNNMKARKTFDICIKILRRKDI